MKRPLLLLSLLLILLAACQSAQPQQQTQSTGAAPSAQPPSGQASGDLCANPYLPAVEGATWTYTMSTDFEDITQVDTITDVGDDAFLIETVQPELSYVTTWHCSADGLLWLQSDGGIFSAVFQTGSGTSTVETLSYSGVSLPRNVQPGDTWTTTEEIHASGSGVDETFTISAEMNAVGMDTITVPAGSFEALRIDLVMSNSSSVLPVTIEESYWYAANVGVVKSTGIVNTSLSFDLELDSYSIP